MGSKGEEAGRGVGGRLRNMCPHRGDGGRPDQTCTQLALGARARFLNRVRGSPMRNGCPPHDLEGGPGLPVPPVGIF
eukprot:7472271-Pyramimonas_sp.AAC.1